MRTDQVPQTELDAIVPAKVTDFRGGSGHLIIALTSDGSGREFVLRLGDVAGFLCGPLVGATVSGIAILDGGSMALDLALRRKDAAIEDYPQIRLSTDKSSLLTAVMRTSSLRSGKIENEV